MPATGRDRPRGRAVDPCACRFLPSLGGVARLGQGRMRGEDRQPEPASPVAWSLWISDAQRTTDPDGRARRSGQVRLPGCWRQRRFLHMEADTDVPIYHFPKAMTILKRGSHPTWSHAGGNPPWVVKDLCHWKIKKSISFLAAVAQSRLEPKATSSPMTLPSSAVASRSDRGARSRLIPTPKPSFGSRKTG
jgi:hypothetical protein